MNKEANYKLNVGFLRDLLSENRIKISEFNTTFKIEGISQRTFDYMISKKNLNKNYSYKKFETLANGINSWFIKEGSKKRVAIKDLIKGGELPEESKIIRTPMKLVKSYFDFPWFMFENNIVLYNDGQLSQSAALGFEDLMNNFIDPTKNPKYSLNDDSLLKKEIGKIKKNAQINEDINKLSTRFNLNIYTCELELPLFNFTSHHFANGRIFFQTTASSNYYAIIYLSTKIFKEINFQYQNSHTLTEINEIIKKYPFDKSWGAGWEYYDEEEMIKKLTNQFRIEALRFYDSKKIIIYDRIIELFGNIEKKNVLEN